MHEPFKLTGLVCEGNKPNVNGRIFPIEVLAKQVDFFNTKVEHNTFYGELGTPRNPKVNPKKTSHLVTGLYLDGDNLMANIETIDTKPGEKLKCLLAAGIPISFCMSGYGTGSVTESGLFILSNYDLIQIFACSYPITN